MKKEKCVVVIPTHSNYFDICHNFISVLKQSWSDCPYRIVISACGEEKPFDAENLLQNGAEATLLDCLTNAAKQYPSERYLVFLGDAFMCGRVEQERVEELLVSLSKNGIDYCSLRPKPSQEKVKRIDLLVRYIHKRDRYNHSFICFAATNDYLLTEFADPTVRTDLDWEVKYLQKVNSAEEGYYDTNAILTEDIFHVRPGIEKGRWDRRVLARLKRLYPQIEFSSRERLGIARQIYCDLYRVFMPLIPNGLRRFIKKAVGKLTKKNAFSTNT